MRGKGIIIPKEFSVIDNSITNEGRTKLTSDAGYELELVREGEELKDTNNFYMYHKTGVVAGLPYPQSGPDANGYMPDQTISSFSGVMAIKSDTEPTANEWMGQASLGVRDFRGIDFVDSDTFFGRNLSNSRMFSYNDGLYWLGENINRSDGMVSHTVKLFKWTPETSQFNIIHIFDDLPPDSSLDSIENHASADWCVHNDELYITYRITDTDPTIQKVVLYKASSQDLLEWKRVSVTDIEDTHKADRGQFRLRMAANDEAILFVYYIVYTESNIEMPEARSYVSFDGGRSFSTRDTASKNVEILGDKTVVSNLAATGGIAQMFIPRYVSSISRTTLKGFTVKFDLYYDENMASFVIVKAGDPSNLAGWDNERYLMAVKTSDDGYNTWEMCLKHILDVHTTVDAKEADGVLYEPWNIAMSTDGDNSYWIDDVLVVPGEYKNVLVMTVESRQNDHGLTLPKNTVFSEFTFTDSSSIPPGLYDGLIGYGGKYHEDYIWISTPINMDQSGLLSTGKPRDSFNSWSQPVGTTWRNQVVVSAKNKMSGTAIEQFSFMAILRPWQNIREAQPYEYAYTRYIDASIDDFGFEAIDSNGSATFEFGWNVCTTNPANNIGAYHQLEPTSDLGVPNIIEKAGHGDNEIFKTKFTFKVSDLTTGTVNILEVALDNADNARSLKLTIDFNGHIIVANMNNDLVATISHGLDLSKEWEILTGITARREGGGEVTWLQYREVGSLVWVYGCLVDTSIAFYDHTITPSYYRIGAHFSTLDVPTVRIGDVHISSFGRMFRPIFNRFKGNYLMKNEKYSDGGAWQDPSESYLFDSYCNEVDWYGNEIDIWDGARLRMVGKTVPNEIVKWSLTESISPNSEKLLTDGIVDNAFDFTPSYTTSIAVGSPEPHCHCYKLDEHVQEGFLGEGKLIVMEAENLSTFDSFSLFNISGIHCFELISGEYNHITDSWSTHESQSYSIPRTVLTTIESISKRVQIEESYEKNQLVDYTVLVYDVANDYYTDQLMITSNHLSILTCDKDVPNLTGKELHLMYQSASYEVPELIGKSSYRNLGIRFYSPDIANLRAIGQFVAGSYFDLDDYVSVVNKKETSLRKIITSKAGYSFMSRVIDSNIIEELDISMPDLSLEMGDFEKIKNLMFKLNGDAKPVTYIEQIDGDDSNVSYFGIVSSPSIKPNQYGFDINAKMILQNWQPKANTSIENLPPVFVTLYVDAQSYIVGESMTFAALAEDPEGTAVAYVWVWGDGTADGSGVSTTHSFSAIGEYVVVCTATDEDGVSSTGRLKILIADETVNSILVEQPIAGNLTVGDPHNYTATLKNGSDLTLVDDNSTKLKIRTDSSFAIIDADGNGIFNQAPDLEYYAVTNGVFTFGVKAIQSGYYTITVTTEEGIVGVISTTFI